MNEKGKLRLSENGRLPDGSMRFVVRLPKEVADLFEQEMRKQDRKKLPLARYIIRAYLQKKDYEDFVEKRVSALRKASQ